MSEDSQKQNDFYKDLISCMKVIKEPKKTAQGYGYSYAPLDEVIAVIKPAATKNNITFLQFPMNDGERVGIETVIIHSSGQEIRTKMAMPTADVLKGGNAAQELGAVITYLRRYALMSAFGLAAEEDTDAASPKARSVKSNDKINKKQLSLIFTLSNEKNISPDTMKKKLHEEYGVESSRDLTKKQASEIIKKLKEIH